MPKFLDTTDQPTYGIGICDRCSRKMPLAELLSDPNSPGLKVCAEDRDEFDPYRLPPKQPDQINLPFYRPDTPMTFEADMPSTDSTTWIPRIVGETIAGTIGLAGDAAFSQTGHLVQLNFQMVATVGATATGNILISGLPLGVDALAYGTINLDSVAYPVRMSADPGGREITVEGLGSSPLDASDITSGTNISFVIAYLTGD